ncbi:MAG TPA: murein biosynthesis integral membrane protein MurJ [Polyangiaceae bacterium]|jgi:putative peptidoglycan lipid II flippase|nr:murein biosynthesis integral membrane protein MurJ [Polyangiaceae bacterium]
MTSEGERERRKLAGRAGIVGLGTLASRVLGLGRDMALAAIFGRGETDAFFVAFTIPNALRSLLAEGAVTSAVVPVLSAKLATDGEDAAKDFFAKIRGISLVALTITTALGVAFAGPLCELFASGYHARAGEFQRTVTLTRILFPYIFFMGTAALGMAALNAKKKFAVAAFAPALLNVSFLACAFLLPGPLERAGMDRAWAMGIGALIGGVLQVAAQIPALRAIGFASAPRFALDPVVRDALRRLVPIMFGVGIYQIDLVLSRRFLSELPQGSQSYFSWAMRLCDFPQGIFVMALSTAALPSLATFAAKKEWDELRKTYAHGMRLAMFVAIPCSAALVMLGEPIVRALFERGAFDAVSSHETAKALLWQGAAIWTVAAVRQLVPVYYALGDTRTPVLVSAIDLIAFVVLAIVLRGSMGQAGISAAVAGSSAVQMVLLFAFARGKLGGLAFGEIGGSVIRTLVASVIAAVAAYSVARLCGVSSHVLPGLAAIATFGVLFLAVAWAVRSPELEEITSALRRRLGRGKVAAS